MSQVKTAIRAVAMSAFAMVALASFVTSASAAEKEKEISRVIGKEMREANKAIQAGKWADAIKALDEASAKSGINAFDRSKIAEFKGYSYIKLGNYKGAMSAYEDGLATGVYGPEETNKTLRTLFTLAASTQQYSKALEYGKKLVDAGAANNADLDQEGDGHEQPGEFRQFAGRQHDDEEHTKGGQGGQRLSDDDPDRQHRPREVQGSHEIEIADHGLGAGRDRRG